MPSWKSNKPHAPPLIKQLALCLVSRILKIKFLALNLCWRREWDSNPRTPESLRFSRPVHSTSYAIPPYKSQKPVDYLTMNWRSGRDSNSRSGEPRLTVQQTVPLQPLGYRSITRPRARKTKTKVYGFRSKRNSWGILLFLYKLYRKRWHPLSRIAVYFETQGKECNQKEIKKQQQHFFDTVLFLRGLSGCGGGTRTHDLQLMGLTSYQLLPLRHMVPAVGVEPTTFGV